MKSFCIFGLVFFLLGVFSVSAQDLIVLKDGSIIEVKVIEISSSEIRYKRFDHLDGPTIVINAANVLSIKYENGRTEIINSVPATAKQPRQERQPLQRNQSGNAFSMSWGFGGNFAFHSDIYSSNHNEIYFGKRDLSKDIEHVMTTGGGFFGFFDATYVEANIGMFFGSMIGEYIDGRNWGYEIFRSYLSFGLYGKYPFNWGLFNFFPMLGIQFDLGLPSLVRAPEEAESTKQANSDPDTPPSPPPPPPRDEPINRFWIKLGAGADFNFTDKIYLRPSILYGINFGSKNNRDTNNEIIGSVHDGFDFRLALGFKL